ncbi:hypothetical protein GPECTOR_30g165 [Gonium pectorale]|uniref:Aminoacyl-tRNA synthetase class Ia domain-containing protein n=1 Tax=Gonium pectorale TaxID=33097 RepID=A0A150GFG4_GONPE|nr:hypothetical protein GPECTOR_30g165 [Gonium pectorale]|eukprot:KXZ48070.1 hypothetical protein GPECTOR_30g165 [Gonium pectorale]
MALGCLARVVAPILPGASAARSALRVARPLSTVAMAKGAAAAAGPGGKKGKKAAKEDGGDEASGPYSPTVRLPATEFSLRANSPVREPQIQAYWEQQAIYESLVEQGSGEPYTLHDGPPYQLLQGRRAKFVPGWDTHGLPIELKVLQSLPDKERKALVGVPGRGGGGEGSGGLKPVHWSPSSRTALAEAELEYPEGHRSTSVYVAMPLTGVGAKASPQLAEALQGAGFAIWTTTPWTIPANLAVAINDQLEYCVVEAQVGPHGATRWHLLMRPPRLCVCAC